MNDQKTEVYEALTVQALRMMNEVFAGAGMSQDAFVQAYLGGLGEYERRIAKKHGITIPRHLRKKATDE